MASPVEGVLEFGTGAPLRLTDALLAFVVHAPHAARPALPGSSGYGFRYGALPNNSAPPLPEMSPPRRLSRPIAASTRPTSVQPPLPPIGWRRRDHADGQLLLVFPAAEIEAGGTGVEEEVLQRHLGTSWPHREASLLRNAKGGGGLSAKRRIRAAGLPGGLAGAL